MKKILNILVIIMATFTFSSCLKDDLVENQTYGMIDLNSKKIVGFNKTTQSYALAYENEDRILEIPVRLSSENPAEEDITVTLSLENSAQLIEEFNAENEQEYEVFNPALYELQGSGLSVTIPKGEREGYLKIKVNAITFDPSSTYALGFTIKSVSGNNYLISGNFGNLIASFGAKNIYDGIYNVSGTMVDANGAYKGDYPRRFSLTTTSATRVTVYDVDYDYPQYIIINNAGTSAATTGIALAFTFDPVTNALVSITDPASPTRVFTNVSGSFDPSTRKIIINWTSGRWTVSETWNFEEER